jgi:hypothetical protein
MKARSILALVAGVAIALAVAVSPTDAAKKKCPKICKDQIIACKDVIGLPSTCTQEVKADKKACKVDKRTRRKECKTRLIAKCKDNADPLVCSPSGAFIDASLEAY